MESVREKLQVFVRRFGLLNASCCEVCCGEEVSLVQSHILFEVRRMGEPSMQQIAEELGIDVTTFSRQIKAMEGKGFVTRRPSAKDRRVSLLGLTDEGRRVLGQIDRYMAEKIGQLFTVMTPFEREVATRSLGLLNEALARVAEPSPGRKNIACCN
ncbi:MAG: MarR family transcriptional [Geobacteraceae bacterium]|nr:MAG: MarR family transcriptional [Geobacteraceae bacterium]